MDGHNRLGSSTSPYLLQHADNPVHWWPWGDEAFAAARERDLPILLSVGYATCHWCHVMAHESFEDPATADDMNRWFISIKVDREERPDVDRIYMDAVQTMTGRGGWPMTVFLTPDGKPFYAGTYFPPTDRHGHPSFRRVLFSVHDAWVERRDQAIDQAERLTAAIDIAVPATQGIPDRAALRTAIEAIVSSHDAEYGGFGGAPKFPQAPTLEFLLRAATTTWGDAARDPLVTSLTAMARGGIHDRIGGGFARYAVDRRWVVPHFEKMLYDNALLASVYARAATLTGDAFLGLVAGSTLDYLLRDLRLPDAGFASGEDADSEGHEGTFYVFGHDEVSAAAGDAATPVSELLGVTPGGNFEGRNVLHQAADPEVVARRHGMDPADLLAAVESTLTRLGEIRGRRIRPARDDKVVTAWNALAIRALVDGAHHLGEHRYLAAAEATGEFLLSHLFSGGRLHRTWRHGRLGPAGFCDDHAALALACFSLFSATGGSHWYQAGAELCETLLARFVDESGSGFWATAADAARLITRPKNLFDNPTPSDNALAAEAMLHMAAFTGESRWWDHLDATLRAGGDIVGRYPGAAGHLLAVALARDLGIVEVAVVGERREVLEAVLRERVHPAMVIAPGDGISPSPVPLLDDRRPIEGMATAYVCRGHVCDRPVTAPDDLRLIMIGSE